MCFQVRLWQAPREVHAAVPGRGGAGAALRAGGRARRGGHGVGGPRGLPALARAAEGAAASEPAVAAARGTPRRTQGTRLQSPHPQAVVRTQTQAPSTTFHTHRLSRRISLLDLMLGNINILS